MLASFLANLATTMVMIYLYQRFCPFRRIQCDDTGWQPISTFPHDKRQPLLITDGYEVESGSTVYYDKNGKIVFGYPRVKATHWRELPKPPVTM